eukprot:jgi/Botrbrau1/15878/Bobra.40_1s0062.1
MQRSTVISHHTCHWSVCNTCHNRPCPPVPPPHTDVCIATCRGSLQRSLVEPSGSQPKYVGLRTWVTAIVRNCSTGFLAKYMFLCYCSSARELLPFTPDLMGSSS